MVVEAGVSRLDGLRATMEAAKRRFQAAVDTKRRLFSKRNGCDSADERAENHNQCMAAEREIADAREAHNAAATTYTDDKIKEMLNGDEISRMI